MTRAANGRASHRRPIAAPAILEEVLRLIAQAGESLRGLVLDASGINDIDYSAAKMMLQLRDGLGRRRVAYAVVTSTELVARLRRYGFTGAGGPFPTLDAAVNALATATAVVHL